MAAQELDQASKRLTKQDCATEVDAFREGLLKRCLAVLDADAEGAYIDDAELEMLAAAGDPFSGYAKPDARRP